MVEVALVALVTRLAEEHRRARRKCTSTIPAELVIRSGHLCEWRELAFHFAQSEVIVSSDSLSKSRTLNEFARRRKGSMASHQPDPLKGVRRPDISDASRRQEVMDTLAEKNLLRLPPTPQQPKARMNEGSRARRPPIVPHRPPPRPKVEEADLPNPGQFFALAKVKQRHESVHQRQLL